MNPIQFCIPISVIILLGMMGCGDSKISAIAVKHNQICESVKDPANCPPDVDLSGLIMFCKMTSSVFLNTEDCNAQMDNYVTCNARRSWACLEGGEVPIPVQPDTCSDEDLAPFVLPSGECVDESKVSSSP